MPQFDGSKYESARRGVASNYTANSAANEYSRFISQQRGERGLADQKRGFSRGWAPRQSEWGRRNMAGAGTTSGFQQQAMQDYVGDYARNRNYAIDDMNQSQQQYALQESQLQAQRDQAFAELELRKQQEIGLLAQNISAVGQGY